MSDRTTIYECVPLGKPQIIIERPTELLALAEAMTYASIAIVALVIAVALICGYLNRPQKKENADAD